MKSLEQGAACLPDGKKPLGAFICQGKVDPKLIEAMYRMFPSDNLDINAGRAFRQGLLDGSGHHARISCAGGIKYKIVHGKTPFHQKVNSTPALQIRPQMEKLSSLEKCLSKMLSTPA